MKKQFLFLSAISTLYCTSTISMDTTKPEAKKTVTTIAVEKGATKSDKKSQLNDAVFAVDSALIPAIIPSNQLFSSARWVHKTGEKFTESLKDQNASSQKEAIIFKSSFFVQGQNKGQMHFEEKISSEQEAMDTVTLKKDESLAFGRGNGILQFVTAQDKAKQVDTLNKNQIALLSSLFALYTQKKDIKLSTSDQAVLDTLNSTMQNNIRIAYNL